MSNMTDTQRLAFDTTGPDAAVLTIGGYGGPVIARIAKPEAATPEQWAVAKRLIGNAVQQHNERL